MRQKREKLMRFGVTVPQNLLSSFDARIKTAGLPSRSEALRKLILEYVSRDTWQKGTGKVYGTITMTYNHHSNEVVSRLTSLQHDFGSIIVCTTHVHADHERCLETVMVRGDVDSVKRFITALRSLKAVSSVNPVIAVLV